MPSLKKDAPPELLATLQQLEARADDCFRALRLLEYPSDLATWSLLVGGVRFVEREQAAHGTTAPGFAAMLLNLGRVLPIAIKWVARHGRVATVASPQRWTTGLSAAVDEAIAVAGEYSHFESCFPMFHKDRYAIVTATPTMARFTALGSSRDRQVSAHQKGCRPRDGAFAARRGQPQPQTASAHDLFESTLRGCRRIGVLQFSYADPWDLWQALLPEYGQRLSVLSRRADDVSLGPYTLADFKAFYAGLMVIAAAHEFLCFRWGQTSGVYPLESAVLVRSQGEWSSVLSALTGVLAAKCESILADLTFRFKQSVDLHVHPLVPLDSARTRLALAPPFPLNSRPDENILRVCSQLRPRVFDASSAAKEAELLAFLRARIGSHSIRGPVGLPDRVPDIDLLVVDEPSSTLVIAELKWIRKTVRPFEIPDRDADVLKGVDQLKTIRTFLAEQPDHVVSQGALPRRVQDYAHVYYFLVARDHWRWVDLSDGIAIIEFDAFLQALDRTNNLETAAEELLRFDWLPVEGRDFEVRYEAHAVNGVAIESEIFYVLGDS